MLVVSTSRDHAMKGWSYDDDLGLGLGWENGGHTVLRF